MIKSFFYTLKQSLLQLVRNKTMALTSLFSITAMLLILGMFFILAVNVNLMTANMEQQFDMVEVYLLDETPEEEIQTMVKEFEALDTVAEVEYLTKEDAMQGGKCLSAGRSLGKSAAPVYSGDRQRRGGFGKHRDLRGELLWSRRYQGQSGRGGQNSEDYRCRSGGSPGDYHISDYRLRRGGVQYRKADGTGKGPGDQHYEVCGGDKLVYPRAFPGRRHYHRNDRSGDIFRADLAAVLLSVKCP